MIATNEISNRQKNKEGVLDEEIKRMLDNPNPLTGIYSIYGDYPIDPIEPIDGKLARPISKKLEIMRAVR